LDRGEHILDKYPVARGGVVDQHVRDRSDELAILDDGGARYEFGQVGTTIFKKNSKSQWRKKNKSAKSCKNLL